MKYLSIIIFLITSWNLSAQQQLLTPYNGTLSSTAQQTLQYYQADTTLTQIGIYEVNGKAFYENTLNVNFGNQSFQFFLDRRGKIATRKFWSGASVFGDKLNSIYQGNNSRIKILTNSNNLYLILNLESTIHGVFILNEFIQNDNCGELEEDNTETESESKNGDEEVHCINRIGIGFTSSAETFNFNGNGVFFPPRTVFITDMLFDRFEQMNQVYVNSISPNGSFNDISSEIAFIQRLPNYTEIDDKGVVLQDFRDDDDNNMDEFHLSRDFFNADYCGLVWNDTGFEDGGGRAYKIRARKKNAFVVLGARNMNLELGFHLSHEIGHLYGCVHDFWSDLGTVFNGKNGLRNADEEWRTVMAFGEFDDDGNQIFGENRSPIHSNPNINASVFDVNDSEPMGKSGAFCIKGIANRYMKAINFETTPLNQLNLMIRTDGINGAINNMPSVLPFDNNIIYADILAVHNITFAETSRIGEGYIRQLRAGNSIDINSLSNSNFSFDAELGSEVDIFQQEFVHNPDDCEPFQAKSAIVFENSIIVENYERLTLRPNPAYTNTIIEFKLYNESKINLWVVNSLGRTIDVLEYQQVKSEGQYSYTLDVSNYSKGIYMIYIAINDDKMTKKLVVIK